MPIYEIICHECGYEGEVLDLSGEEKLVCPECESSHTQRVMSATSSITGKSGQSLPGPGDTGCCGSAPGHSGCAGPGSCCGKNVS